MSKIFEALNKGQRDSLDLVEIRAENPGPAPQAVLEPPAAQVETSPGINPGINPINPGNNPGHNPGNNPGNNPETHQRATPMEDAEAQAAYAIPAAEGALAARSIRTLPLHLAAQTPVLPFDGGQGRASEQYRMARTRILQDPHARRIILISSPGPRDGKTTSAINLAGALSLRAGFKVLLVDGDFRRSTVHTALGLPAGPGLADVLSGACTLEDALVHVEEFPNLYVLPSGNCEGNPAELLDSAQWVTLQATLRKRFRAVVVDSPPIAAVADYELLLAGADGVILVLRVDHTNRKAAFDAIQSLPKEKFMGVLLNCVEQWFLGKGQSYSDSYYYERQ